MLIYKEQLPEDTMDVRLLVILERHYCMTVHWYCIIFCWKSRTRKRQRLKNRKRNSKKILADKILKEYKKTGQDQGGIIE